MQLLRAWGRMLRGATPLLSIEITRECPLHCPGCYAYGAAHLGGGVDCAECGCTVSAGPHAPRSYRLLGGVSVGTLIDWMLAAKRLNRRGRIPPNVTPQQGFGV